MDKMKLNILLLVLAAGMLLTGIFFFKGQVRELEYYYPVERNTGDKVDAQKRHVVSDFSLIDQAGKVITRKDFENSVTVVDFFFTTCQGICPRMTSQMQRVYEKFKGNSEVKFLSHTVNPEHDSSVVLAEYANRYHADPNQWHFVTGDKPQLYNLARKSYLVSNTEGDGSKEDFVHSENFALVDKEGHVRGIYNGTDPKEVDQLIIDINILLEEYHKK